MELDRKQMLIVRSWRERAMALSGDEYGRFMAAWVAFNAVCTGLFGDRACRRRADLGKERGLDGLVGTSAVAGTIEQQADRRVCIRIDTPGPIRIDIRERYTEDLVFREFGCVFANTFASWLEAPSVERARDGFLASLRKRSNKYYVVNMLKADSYQVSVSLNTLKATNVVVAVDDPSDLRQLVAALYQVRCNVFHGEKTPGEPNDDRVVRSALPFLLQILDRALEQVRCA